MANAPKFSLMKKTNLLLLFGFLFFLQSCVNMLPNDAPKIHADHVTEKRETLPFFGISVDNGINVYLNYGPQARIEVQAEAKVLPHIQTDVRNGLLNVFVNGHTSSNRPINVYVTYQNLSQIHASTAAKIWINSPLKNNSTHIQSSTGSQITIRQIDTDFLYIESSAKIQLTGNAGLLNAQINSGEIDAAQLIVDRCQAKLLHNAFLSLHVLNEINANLSENANLKIFGQPKIQNIQRPGIRPRPVR